MSLSPPSMNRQVFQFSVWSETCRPSQPLLWFLNHLSCEPWGFRKNSPLKIIGRRTSMWSSLATAIQGNGNKKQQSEVFQIWVLALLPVNPLMYSKGCSVHMSMCLAWLFIPVECTWKVHECWTRGCNFFWAQPHTWGTQRPKHCQHGIRARTRPVCENGRVLQAMRKVIKVQSLAMLGRHSSKSWVSTQKKRLKQDKRWCWRTTSPLWRLRCCHLLTMAGPD